MSRTQVFSTQIQDNSILTADIADAQITDAKLSATGVAAGQYAQLTVNTKGRVTGGSAVLPTSAGGTGVSATPQNGQLSIGNGTGFTLATLTPGNGIYITNNPGGITVSTNFVNNIAQIINGQFSVASGTSTIPYDASPPTSTEGTQVWSQSITPTTGTSKIRLSLSTTISFASYDSGIIVAVFRGTTLIGVQVIDMNAQKLGSGINGGGIISFDLFDSPATTGPVTYSIRTGTLSTVGGTWYFGRMNAQSLGNSTVGNYSLMEFTA